MVSDAGPSFVVVDSRCRIKYASAGSHGDGDLNRLLINRVKLQPEVETFVRGLATPGRDEAPSPVRFRFLDDERILRVVRVVGDEGAVFILNIEEDRNRNSLIRAARRHELTRRETEVLALILDGSSAGEIADLLAISEHTVQGYFKRLLFKTKARNRVSMVAGILDWDKQARVDPATTRERFSTAPAAAI